MAFWKTAATLLGCYFLGIASAYLTMTPRLSEIEFTNAMNGNRTILRLRPDGKGVLEEFERLKEHFRKQKEKQ